MKKYPFGMSKKLYRLNVGMMLTLVIITALTATVLWIRAAGISNSQDLMSNQSIGGFSTHRINFNLSGGNTFSAGELIAVDFSDGFTLGGSWQTTDFSVIDSGARTVLIVNQGPGVTTVTCSQNTGNEVGIAVDTTTSVFRVIPCTGAPVFNTSAPGATVSLTINGANPNGTLANPVSSGSYKVVVEDAAGDCIGGCKIGIPIVDSGLVSVTATVDSIKVCGNGFVEIGEQCDDGNLIDNDGCSSSCRTEGGTPPPTDTTPPVMDYHCAIDITRTEATISWDTDEFSDSMVRCGKRSAVYNIIEQDLNFVLQHRIPLSGLTAATMYYCQACSKDSAGNMACTNECMFSTLDELPPDYGEVMCTDPTENSFTVRWTTDELASSYVDYGLDPGPPYSATVGNPALVTDHVVVINGLQPGNSYHYRASSGDSSGNENLSLDQVCGTTGGELPIISNVAVDAVGCTTAEISWNTNVGADTRLEYGIIPGPPYAQYEQNPTYVLDHNVHLLSLLPGTLYYFRPISVDMLGNDAIGPDQTFMTSGDGPLEISNVSTVGITPTSATVIWNTNKYSNSRVDYGETGNYSNSTTNPDMVLGHTVELSNLDSCTEYLYRVVSSDMCGGTKADVNHRFTTVANPTPIISNVQVSSITGTSARVTWDTTMPSNSIVRYGTTSALGSQASGAGMTTSHFVIINGLIPGTTYRFRAHSSDTCRQEADSEILEFTTLGDNVPPACAMSMSALPGDTMIFLSWENPTDADLAGARVLRKSGSCPAGPNDGTIIYEGLNETFIDDGLVNGLSYCYGAFPYDAAGNFGCGSIDSAIPEGLPDTTPPACPGNFRAQPGDEEVLLTWDDPADPDFAGVRIQRGPGDMCPLNYIDGLTIYEGTNNVWLDATVMNDVEYCYGLFSYDSALNFCAGVTATARPAGTEDVSPPSCATNLVVTPGDGMLLVTWENPNDVDWAGTRIVRRDDRYPTGPEDGAVVFDGIGDYILDIGLTNGVTYYYGVFAYDEVPNFCLGAVAQGVSEEGAPTPVPSCTDSDGGRNYFSRGTVTLDENLQYIDACVNKDILQENYCAFGTLATENYNCGIGYKCSAGRCVPDVYEPPIQQCGNGICEKPDCEVDCGAMTYDLYIINPDLTERHMHTEWVKVTDLEDGLSIISFEDKGEDWDYNDVEFRLDVRDCSNIVVTLISHNARWNHQVRLLITYRQVPKLDRLVWQDSHVDIGDSAYMNVTDDASICRGTENSINCPEDCPASLPVPDVDEEVTVGEEDHIQADRLEFYATEGRLPLVVIDETVSVFPAMAVTTVLPFDELTKPVKTAFFNFEGSTYVMVPTETGFEARMVMPQETGLYPFAVIIEYVDGTLDVIRGYFRVVPFGRVVEQINKDLFGVDGARVTLLVDLGNGNYGLWNGDVFGQYNPMYSSDNGSYGFIVPPGNYILRSEKAGYRTKETLPFPVRTNLITRDLLMIRSPEQSILGYLFGPRFLEGIAAYLGFGADSAIEDWREFSDNPFVEDATKKIAPGIFALAAANILVAGAATATAVPYLLYLYSLLTHPSLLLAARRRKKWGVVFNSITKKPVDLAIVRLIDERTGKIIRSMVTDVEGRYFFMVNKGNYRMVVAKVAFIFPTIYLKGETEDIRYTDLYHGESITVDESTSITANIPIDPIAREKTPRAVVWEGITRRFQRSLSIITLVAMAGAAIITPTPFIIGLFAANVVMYLFFRRLAKGRKPKNWGIVYDDRTKKPLRNAVVRVFEARYNKLLDTKVTDIRGRYAFLVGTNVYHVTYEKPGYQKKQIGPLDLVEIKKEEDQLIASDISLETSEKRGAWETFAERIKGIFNPLGVSKASIDKEPLAGKIGMTGSLLVGPGAKIQPIKIEEPKKEVEVKAEPEKKADNIPWELKALQGMQVEKKPEEIKEVAPVNDVPPVPFVEQKADEAAKELPKVEDLKPHEIPWELKELQNMRYDSEEMNKDNEKKDN